jgi:hypothetical protein
VKHSVLTSPIDRARRVTSRLLIALVALVCVSGSIAHALPDPALQSPSRQAALQIVVVEGEDAVNIVQQKTAVAPVVEVRDRNDQPVAGAVVRFAITKGRATFSGARTLTVTTNAAGRAAVSGLAPTGAGSLQISATAAFQGQTAVATIAQTNVMTVAQAAAVSGSAGGASGSASGGAAGGGGASGGGLSATTVGIVGGAVAGGLVAVKEIKAVTSVDKYVGQYSGTMIWRFQAFSTCTYSNQISGTLRIELKVADGGSVHGNAEILSGTRIVVDTTCPGGLQGFTQPPPDYGWGPSAPEVSGTTGNLGFSVTGVFDNGNSGQWDFTGALNGNSISGTLTHTSFNNGFNEGVVVFPMTLTLQ